MQHWRAVSQRFAREIVEKDDEVVAISMGEGKVLHFSRENNILSCFLHESCHLGQFITTFRLITGKDAVNLDHGSFLVELSKSQQQKMR